MAKLPQLQEKKGPFEYLLGELHLVILRGIDVFTKLSA